MSRAARSRAEKLAQREHKGMVKLFESVHF